MILHGYQSYNALKALIENVSEGAITERPVQKSEEAILRFIEHFESVGPIEIKSTFELTDQEYNCAVGPLLNQEEARKVWAGNGYLLRMTQRELDCDSELAACSY